MNAFRTTQRRSSRAGRWRAVAALLAMAVLGAAAEASAQLATNAPWPMLQRNLDHTGRSGLLGPLAAEDVKTWAAPDKIKSSPAIGADGTIYVGVGFSLCAINPDMTTKWCTRMHGDQSPSSPAIAQDGTIFIGNRGNTVASFDPDGNPVWFYADGYEGDIRSSPAIGPDGTVYIAFNQNAQGWGVVTALDPATQTKKWHYTVGSSISTSSAALRGGVLYIGALDGKLYALRDDGNHATPVWTPLKLGTAITASPVLGPDGTIYVGSNTGLHAVDSATGHLLWSFLTTGAVDQTAALGADGTIFFGTVKAKQKIFYAISDTGAFKWQFGPILTESADGGFPVIGADGIVYAAIGTTIYAFNPLTGAILWSYPVNGTILSFPAIGGSAVPGAAGSHPAVIYVTSAGARLYAISSLRGGNVPPTVDAGPNQQAVPTQLLSFHGSAFDPNPQDVLTFSWNFGDGSTGSGQDVTHAYATTGLKTVTLTVSDGHSTAQDTLTVNVTQPGGNEPFSDTFTRADSTNLGSDWQEVQGNLVIASGAMQNAAQQGVHIAVIPPLIGLDQTLAADFSSSNNTAAPRIGIVLRHADNLNYYVCYRKIGAASLLRIAKVVGGTETVLGQYQLPNPPVGSIFRLECSVTGTTLELKLAGTVRITTTDTTFASGKPGIMINTGTSSSPYRVDNVDGISN